MRNPDELAVIENAVLRRSVDVERSSVAPDLKQRLTALGLQQTDLARLLGVTPRAVALWCAGQRSVPDWCEAYLRVFQALPKDLREMELARLKGMFLREGLYEVNWRTSTRLGVGGTVLFDSGHIWGSDRGGCRFDGEYRMNPRTARIKLTVQVAFPPDVLSIYGITRPHEWKIDTRCELDPAALQGQTIIRTSIGRALAGTYRFMRPLSRSTT